MLGMLSTAMVPATRAGQFSTASRIAPAMASSLAQIDEFSFILVGLGVALGMMPVEGRDLVLAGAIISILLNPVVFALIERQRARVVPVPSPQAPEAAGTTLPDAPPAGVPPAAPAPAPAEPPMPLSPAAEAGPVPTGLTDHDVIIGYGRVGSLVGARLAAAGRPVLVFEERDEALAAARRDGAKVIVGNAADPGMLALANLAAARRLFVTIPEAFEAGQVVQQARSLNPGLEIPARAHSDDCVRHLVGLGASLTILGEREIAQRMIERAFPAWATPVPAGRDDAGPEAPAGAG